MIHRYSFPTESKAKEFLTKLIPINSKAEWNQLTVTELTDGVVVLGFEDKYTYDVQTKLSVLAEKGLTYNINIYWNSKPPLAWKPFEVFPLTPSHF